MSAVVEIMIGVASEVPLTSLGLSAAVLRRVVGGVSTLTLRKPATAAQLTGDDPLIVEGVPVRLIVDEEVRFLGKCTAIDYVGGGGRIEVAYTISDAWHDLDRLVWQALRNLAEEPAVPDSDLIEVYSSRTVLFQDVHGDFVPAEEQIADVLTFATAAGVTIVPGVIHEIGEVPWEEATDITCAEAIRRAVRWLPFGALHLLYPAGATTLHVTAKTDLTATDIDLAGGAVREVSVRQRADLVVPGVKITFESYLTIETPEELTTRAQIVVDAAGATTQPGAIVAYVELGAQAGAKPESAPAGLATRYWAMLQDPVHGGSITLKGQECAWTLELGQRLTFSNGRAAWSTMVAPVQAITYDILSGETVVEFGPSEAMSVTVFADLMSFRRLNNKSNFVESRIDGRAVTAAVPPSAVADAGEGGAGDNVTVLEVCDPTPGTVRVRGVFTAS